MSALEFDTSSGLIVPTTESIRTDLATAVQNAFVKNAEDPLLNVDPTSPMGQVVDLMVAEIESKNEEIAFMVGQNNLSTARGVFLDALGALYFIRRKVSQPTVVSCVCTGLKGTTIPYGVVVSTSDGTKLRHTSTEGTTIDASGSITTQFETIEHGAIEVAAHSVNTIDTVIAGWDTIDNPTAGVLGRDRESDSDFLNRIRESVTINSRGTADSIKAGVASVDGVVDCAVLENYTNVSVTEYGVTIGAHSVAISAYGGEDADIAKAIYEHKDVGCGTSGDTQVTYVAEEYNAQEYDYYIVRPVATSFKVNAVFYDEMDDANIQLAVKTIIDELYGENETPRMGVAQTIYASRLIVALGRVLPTYAIQSLTIALGSGSFGASVQIPADKEPTITADDITISVYGG